MGSWTLVRTADGSWTALEPERGRAMHDLAGARTEARQRFVRASGLDRAPAGARVRLLDLGSGLGHNLAAALEAAERVGLRLSGLGFERSAEVLALARALPSDPDPRHERFRRVALGLESFGGGARSDLELRSRDATEELDAVPEGSIDVVFLDGYAPGDGGGLWSDAFLFELTRRLRPGGRVVTYSASARVRACFLAGGLEVFAGGRSGRKGAGTLAVRAPLAGGPLPLCEPLPLAPPMARKLARRADRVLAAVGATVRRSPARG